MRSVFWVSMLAAAAVGATACGQAPEADTSTEVETAEGSPAETKELDVEGVSARLAAGEEITLLDVRTHEELVADGAIEGYLHIPIDELEARLAEVPTDKPLVAY